jgi:glycosyltransferase involved in cell wall biosynthesis
MRCVLADPDEVERLRTSARQRAETSYSWDSITDEYDAYFAGLLNGG